MKVSELRIDLNAAPAITWGGGQGSPIVKGRADVAFGFHHAIMSIDTFNFLRDLAAQGESAAAQRAADLKRINELEEKMAGMCPTHFGLTAKWWHMSWANADAQVGKLKDRVRELEEKMEEMCPKVEGETAEWWRNAWEAFFGAEDEKGRRLQARIDELESQLREARPQPLVNGGNAAYWYEAQQSALKSWGNETSKLKDRIAELESQLREAQQSKPTPPEPTLEGYSIEEWKNRRDFWWHEWRTSCQQKGGLERKIRDLQAEITTLKNTPAPATPEPKHLGRTATEWHQAWFNASSLLISVSDERSRLEDRITELEGSIADAKTALNSSESGNS